MEFEEKEKRTKLGIGRKFPDYVLRQFISLNQTV